MRLEMVLREHVRSASTQGWTGWFADRGLPVCASGGVDHNCDLDLALFCEAMQQRQYI